MVVGECGLAPPLALAQPGSRNQLVEEGALQAAAAGCCFQCQVQGPSPAEDSPVSVREEML